MSDASVQARPLRTVGALLEGRTAIITGGAGAGGIGHATAQLFASHGAHVALLDLAETDPAQVAAALGDRPTENDDAAGAPSANPGGHLGLACDVRQAAACQEAVNAVHDAFGRIDILIGNAGVVFPTLIDDIAPAEYDHVLDVNLRGNFQMAQAVLPTMRAQGDGRLVFISSIAGQVGGGLFGRSHYAAAKSGIFGLAKALARELAPEGIRANAIAPGVIDNDFTKGRMTRAIKDQAATGVPMGRLGRSDDVAGGCLYLASDLSAYVTGQVLSINGGLLIA
ncbi:MAG: SDR family NAD(P)-dependent oxidoreductase [Pseudomonadota bacterium]